MQQLDTLSNGHNFRKYSIEAVENNGYISSCDNYTILVYIHVHA